MNTTAIWQLLRETYNEWSEDRAPRLAAALAYYTVFALAPLLIIVIAIAGLFFGEAQVRDSILNQVGGLIGQNGREAIDAMVQGARKPTTGVIATVIGVITLLFAAGGLFGQLQDALNTIWEVQPKPGRGIWGTIQARFLSFAMVLGVGFLLLVSLMISATLSAVGSFVAGDAYSTTVLWQVVNFVVSFVVTTLLFAMIYKILPDAKVAWRDVGVGAIATAALFSLGRFAISMYLGRAAPESTYGATGSLVALLLWVYYSAQILFLGAEFTQVYAKAYGSKIQPADDAVPVTEEARANQGMPRKAVVAATAAIADGNIPQPAARRITPAASLQPHITSTERVPQVAMFGAIGAFILGLLIGQRKSLRES